MPAQATLISDTRSNTRRNGRWGGSFGFIPCCSILLGANGRRGLTKHGTRCLLSSSRHAARFCLRQNTVPNSFRSTAVAPPGYAMLLANPSGGAMLNGMQQRWVPDLMGVLRREHALSLSTAVLFSCIALISPSACNNNSNALPLNLSLSASIPHR